MSENIKNSKRVIIIGAGISGLSTALQLRKLGWKNVTLLEARDRIGGRVYSKPYCEKYIEMGAQWIHGEEGNIIYKIASENHLIDETVSSFLEILDSSKPLNHLKPHHQLYQQIRSSFSELMESTNVKCDSVGDEFSNFILKQINDLKDLKEIEVAKQIYDWVVRFESHIAGATHLFHVARHENYHHCSGNGTVDLRDDYVSLLRLIARDIPAEWIKLDSPVKKIDYSQNGKITVFCEGDDSFEADHVVITLPLGVLKNKAKNMFNPTIPESKISSIENLGFGTVDKVFLKFEWKFWDEDNAIYNVFWKDGFNHRGFSNKEAFMDGNKSAWTQVDSSQRFPWERFLIYFTSVRHQPTVLCAWFFGEGAEFMENLSDEEVLSGCYSVLRSTLSDQIVPKPVEIVRSKWCRDPFSQGSYSYDSVACNDAALQRSELASPVNMRDKNGKLVPILLFAGEATHKSFYSTVHGAYETGLREASRLENYAQSCTIGCDINFNQLDVKIAVIGAGIAGLAASWQLKKFGFQNVTVYEGNSNIGGRIKTVPFGDNVLEIGAQWVHGEDGNVVFEYAQQRGLLSDPKKDYSVEGKGHFTAIESGFIDEDLVKETIMALDSISESVVTKYDNVEEVKGIPLGVIFQEKFRKHLESYPHISSDTRKIKEAIYEWYYRFLLIDNCCNNLEDLSVKGTNEWIDCPGVPLINFKKGFHSLVENLADEIGFKLSSNENHPKLVINQGVTAVDWNNVEGDKLPSVTLHFTDETEAQFSHVIVTSSVGFLKSSCNFFKPVLPKEKRQALNTIGFGTVNKIYLVFEKPFWERDDLGFQLVWLDDDHKSKFPSWVRGISGFDVVRGQSNVLVGWIGGKEARIMENVSDEEVAKICTLLLRFFIKRDNIQSPVQLIRSKWYSDPYVRGSYSHRLTGYEYLEDSIANLQNPLYVKYNNGECNFPVVFFAGEATSQNYFSSVHGAFESGVREADKIISFYSNISHQS